jgi:hypothetical protein
MLLRSACGRQAGDFTRLTGLQIIVPHDGILGELADWNTVSMVVLACLATSCGDVHPGGAIYVLFRDL